MSAGHICMLGLSNVGLSFLQCVGRHAMWLFCVCRLQNKNCACLNDAFSKSVRTQNQVAVQPIRIGQVWGALESIQIPRGQSSNSSVPWSTSLLVGWYLHVETSSLPIWIASIKQHVKCRHTFSKSVCSNPPGPWSRQTWKSTSIMKRGSTK